jgi:maltooligosyltrehalose synthase
MAGQMWPEPIDGTTSGAVDRAEQIRQRLNAIAEWAENEWTENRFEANIVAGLVTQARTTYPAAEAVSRDLVRVLQRLHESCRMGAAVAKVFGEKVHHLYVEPIEEAKHRPAAAGAGLKVN